MGLTVEQINSRLSKNSRLTVIARSYHVRKSGLRVPACLCICSCGKECTIETTSLVRSNTLSCGCYSLEILKSGDVQRRYTKTVKYLNMQYRAMMDRCYNPRYKKWAYYGGKGVKVCDEWKNSYQPFLDWSLANGWEKGLQLDKDILGDGLLYSPETCKWVTRRENFDNRSNSLRYNYNGKEMPLLEICNLLGVPYMTIYSRLHKNKKRKNPRPPEIFFY